MTSLIDELRCATRDIHARLHGHPSFKPVMDLTPDICGYAHLLKQLHGFHAPAEAWLFDAASALLPELGDLSERRKVVMLKADISALDKICPPPLRTDTRVEWKMLPSRPAVLGGLYVIEGATLGGRELGRRLGPILNANGLPGNFGRQFFLAYEPRQGAMWRRFCDVLTMAASTLTQDERRQTCDAACQAFATFEDWLTRTHNFA